MIDATTHSNPTVGRCESGQGQVAPPKERLTSRCTIEARRVSLRQLNDGHLLHQMGRLRERERRTLLDMLLHLNEVYRRKLHLREGYGSMFRYCTDALEYSKSAACRRIQAARCLGRFPTLDRWIEKGEIRVSHLCLIEPVLSPKNLDSMIHAIRGRTQAEGGANRRPTPAARCRSREGATCEHQDNFRPTGRPRHRPFNRSGSVRHRTQNCSEHRSQCQSRYHGSRRRRFGNYRPGDRSSETVRVGQCCVRTQCCIGPYYLGQHHFERRQLNHWCRHIRHRWPLGRAHRIGLVGLLGLVELIELVGLVGFFELFGLLGLVGISRLIGVVAQADGETGASRSIGCARAPLPRHDGPRAREGDGPVYQAELSAGKGCSPGRESHSADLAARPSA